MVSRRFVLGSGIVATGLALAGPAFAKPGDLSLPPERAQLKTLALTRPDGEATRLGDHLGEGRAAVVSLWATWCGLCSDEASHLAAWRSRVAAEMLDIVGVNIDARRDEQKIAPFLKRANVNFVQLRGDPASTYIGFGGQLPISLPRLYVFTREGKPTKVFGRFDGRATLKAIDAAITADDASAAGPRLSAASRIQCNCRPDPRPLPHNRKTGRWSVAAQDSPPGARRLQALRDRRP